MKRLRSSRRRGFTLIELLVVMGIIIVLASLALLISPRFAEDQRTTRGADMVQGWLLIQKQRSYRDQLPRGIRLVIDQNDPASQFRVREMIYIERPEDLRGDPDPGVQDDMPTNPNNPNNTNHNHMQVPPNTNNAGQNTNQFVFIPNWDLKSNDLVLPGDFLKVNTYENQPYNIHRIAAVFPFPQRSRASNGRTQVQGTLLQLAAADGTPSVVVPGGRIPMEGDTRFQIIRQSRPMSGEPVLQMPRDVIVDLDPTTVGTSILPGNGSNDALDIMFSQRGQVIGSNGNSGKIILRVRNVDKLANPNLSSAGKLVYDSGEQLFIVVHTRTGLITAHPYNDDVTDPYRFTRDAKDSGM